ncbi:MAG TPA: ABC transporter permease [Parvularcula sp.]|nr:ABC transporter permease [Parvularcula sp.]HBS33392.1 ABC transporter permease [Parvularcula sp.]HBS36359.1 ABC transporter permease [Parvularcula sp.]
MNFLGLQILWADFGKATAMILGVAFSTLLMAQQAAIFVCLMANSASHITSAEDVDIWIADKRSDYFDDPGALPAGLVDRVRSVDGVAYAAPFLRRGAIVDTSAVIEQAILVGVDGASLLGAPQKMLYGDMTSLRSADTFIVDRRGYNDIWPGEEIAIGRLLEVDGRVLKLVGVADPPSPFISQPLIYVSLSTAALLAGEASPSFIVARVKDPAAAPAIAAAIEAATGYSAFDSKAFGQRTIDYYLENTGIPINFFITILLGFIVGAAIVIQTFFLFVTENLRHLALFRAMGAESWPLIRMTLVQCALVAAIGYCLGLAAAAWFFETVPGKVPAFKGFYLPAGVVLKTGAVVFAVAIFSGLISIRRAIRLDPAIVLRG